MNGRITLAMLALAVAAGVYVLGFAIPRKTDQAVEQAREKKLVVLKPEEVVRLELPLSTPEGARAKLVRAPGSKDWQLESPRTLRADSFTVQGILESLAQIDVELTIDDPPTDRAQFGLGAAAGQIEIAPQSGEPVRISLGKEAPVGSLRYVEASTRPGVVLGVTSSTLGELTPDLEKLRDRSVIALEPKDIQQVQVELAGKPFVSVQRSAAVAEAPKPEPEEAPGIQVVNEAGEWELTQPIAEKADGERIFRALQDIHFARAESFVDDPVKLSEYGLDKPEARVRLQGTSGAPVEVAFGRKSDKLYARVDGQGPVIEIPPRIIDSLPRTLFEYRFKRVFELADAAAVQRVELEFPRDAKTHAFTLSGDKWSPEAKDLKIGDFRVSDLVYELDRVNATALEEGTPDLKALGLDPPLVKVSIFDKDKKSMGWLALGETTAGKGTAARSSSGDRVWRVVADIGEKIPLGLAAFDDKWIVKEPPPAPPEPPAEAPAPTTPAPAPPTSPAK